MKTICECCGKEFEQYPKNVTKRKFCSRECSYLINNKIRSQNKSKRIKAERAAESYLEKIKAMKAYMETRFIKEGECWIWTAGINQATNSPIAKFRGRGGSAARFVYEAFNNVAVPKNKFLYKKCRNTLCVNPEHLYIANETEVRKCIFCGKEFEVSKVKRKSYCSDSCSNKVKARRQQEKIRKTRIAIPLEIKLKRLRGIIESHKKEDLNGCWNWTGALKKGTHKYGRLKTINPLTDKSCMMIASRASYLAYNGDLPPGMNILHLCDNPQCVNPKHLYAGTSLQNSKDIKSSNKYKAINSKLTVQEVRIIKHRISLGVSFGFLSKEFNVSKSTIQSIKEGKTWKDV